MPIPINIIIIILLPIIIIIIIMMLLFMRHFIVSCYFCLPLANVIALFVRGAGPSCWLLAAEGGGRGGRVH